jgi:hypothetical protein
MSRKARITTALVAAASLGSMAIYRGQRNRQRSARQIRERPRQGRQSR